MTLPKPRREATQLEVDVLAALSRCRLPQVSSKKRFIRDLSSMLEISAKQQKPLMLTEREANYLLLLAYTFRRQINPELMNRVWAEWLMNSQRLRGYRLSGDLLKAFPDQAPSKQ